MRMCFLMGVLLAGAVGCTQLGYMLFGVGFTESQRWSHVTAGKLWEVLQEAVDDYYDIKVADDDEKYLETDWNEHLGPMYRTGKRFRVRAWVRIDDDSSAPFLEVTVDREYNSNMDRPLSASEADWQEDWDMGGRDVSREKRIIWLVNLRLRQIRPSREILENRPSEYREDPATKAREDLWGEGKKEEGDSRTDPPREKDLWK